MSLPDESVLEGLTVAELDAEIEADARTITSLRRQIERADEHMRACQTIRSRKLKTPA